MQGSLEVGIYYFVLCLTLICLYSPNESDLYNLFFTCQAFSFSSFFFFLLFFVFGHKMFQVFYLEMPYFICNPKK